MADYREMVRALYALRGIGRESTNVEDVRAYPPRANPRTKDLPWVYDVAKGEYVSVWPDVIKGMKRQDEMAKRPKITDEEAAALIRSLSGGVPQ
jgi:hypothetical protein